MARNMHRPSAFIFMIRKNSAGGPCAALHARKCSVKTQLCGTQPCDGSGCLHTTTQEARMLQICCHATPRHEAREHSQGSSRAYLASENSATGRLLSCSTELVRDANGVATHPCGGLKRHDPAQKTTFSRHDVHEMTC